MAPSGDVHSIERVANLPVVKSAIGIATGGYDRIKSSSSLVNGTLSRAEKSIFFMAETAKPIVNLLENQITAADWLVCQGLDKLEESVPIVKKSPQELKEVGYEKLERWKKFGTGKVSELKVYGYKKITENPMTKAVLSSVDTAVGMAENTVSYYLPPVEGEDKLTEKMNVVEKVTVLSEKMRKRMYVKAMSQLQTIQKRSAETLQKMNFTVDLIQYAKGLEENGIQKLTAGVNVIQSQAKWIWDELNKDEPEEKNPNESKTIDQQLLSIGRRVTKEAINIYNEISSYELPENVRNAIMRSRDYANNVYNDLWNAKSLKDVSEVGLHQLLTGAETVQKLLVTNLLPIVERFLLKEVEKGKTE